MLRSMTGFGAASCARQGLTIHVEVRSVNNRHYKSTLRLPESLSPLEGEVEAQLARRISRGSVQLTIRSHGSAGITAAQIDSAVLRGYIDQADGALKGTAVTRDLSAFLSLPGVMIEQPGDEFLAAIRALLPGVIDEACDALLAMRSREGADLGATLAGLGRDLRRALAVVAERTPIVVAGYSQRLRQRMDSLLSELGSTSSEADILREVAIFAERSDIAEEVVRLQGHLDQFDRLISPSHGEPVGRTLDFLAQEMLRESNTIASKCSDIEVSRAVVEIKTAIDRMKEQAANVE
ncbi:MAG: YicC family protein [Planctomycetota bacterium]|nr:YicC family protein [Planctomycetota bacterium]